MSFWNFGMSAGFQCLLEICWTKLSKYTYSCTSLHFYSTGLYLQLYLDPTWKTDNNPETSHRRFVSDYSTAHHPVGTGNWLKLCSHLASTSTFLLCYVHTWRLSLRQRLRQTLTFCQWKRKHKCTEWVWTHSVCLTVTLTETQMQMSSVNIALCLVHM